MMKNLLGMHKALSSVPNTTYTEHGGARLLILALGRWKYNNHKFKVVLSFLEFEATLGSVRSCIQKSVKRL